MDRWPAPSLFHAGIDIAQESFPDDVYASILVVAHNSGGSIEGVIKVNVAYLDAACGDGAQEWVS